MNLTIKRNVRIKYDERPRFQLLLEVLNKVESSRNPIIFLLLLSLKTLHTVT